VAYMMKMGEKDVKITLYGGRNALN